MKPRGFTLIELLIVIAIIGILAAIAIPNFTAYMNQGRRSDGISALHRLQQAQERLRSHCRFYAQTLVDFDGDNTDDSSCGNTAATTSLEIDTTSPEGYYSLAITAGTATGNAYTATATASVGGTATIQAGDSEGNTSCSTLTLTVNGANPNGVGTPTACW